jgi:hypothetical protein
VEALSDGFDPPTAYGEGGAARRGCACRHRAALPCRRAALLREPQGPRAGMQAATPRPPPQAARPQTRCPPPNPLPPQATTTCLTTRRWAGRAGRTPSASSRSTLASSTSAPISAPSGSWTASRRAS